MSSHQQFVRFIVLLLSSWLSITAESAPEGWFPSGPEGGSVWALAFDPSGSGRVFSQVAKIRLGKQGGLGAKTSYRLNPDNGAWETLAGKSVDSFAVAGDKTTVLYAMQGQLLKSVDSGRSWQPISAVGPTGGRVYVAPSDPATLYVISSNEDNPETGRAIFYQSNDGGQRWRKGEWPARFISVDTPAAFPGGGALAIDLNNPDILYAVGGGIASGHTVFQSQNSGQSWQQRSSFTELNSNPRTIIVDPHDPQTLFIAADPNIAVDPNAVADQHHADTCNDSGGVFKSSDAGFSWVRLSLAECRVRTLVADPLHAGIIYAGTGSGIYKTSDSGAHWRRISDKMNTLRLAIDPANPQTLIAGTLTEGMLKTDDGGQHWFRLNNGLHEVSVFQLAGTSNDNQVLYAGTAIGIFKSSDGGVSWPRKQLSLHGLPISDLVVDPRDADIVYATDKEHIYKTVDGGLHWTNILNGTGSNFSLSPLRLAPDNANIVFAGADFKSTNQGRNWVINSDVLGHDVGPVITAMTVTPDLSVFVGIANGSLWYDAIGPAQHPLCSALKSEGGRLQQPFLVTSLTAYPSGLFRKQEDGLGWCRTNLPIDHSARIKALEYRASANFEQPGILWVETNQGVFQSIDQGGNWTKTSHLIIPRAIAADTNTIYGVIDNRPVWSQDNGNSWETFNLNLPLNHPETLYLVNRHPRSLTYLPDRKVFLSAGADGIFTYNKPGSFISGFKFMSESPATGTTLSGISSVHGWAFSTQPDVAIEHVSFDPFDIPCCSQRNDVAAAFPQYPAATDSGWGMAINWNNLPEGDKQIRFKVRNSAGETYLSSPKTITIARIAGSSFLDQFNPAQASAEIKDNHLLLKNVSVRDKATGTINLINTRFHWSGANQSFQMLAEGAAAVQTETVKKQVGSAVRVVVAASNGIYSFVDAPADHATVSGIGVIYGWAFSENQKATIKAIQINVDDQAYGHIPCCSIRTDVVQSYGEANIYYPAVGLSGWGVLFNFSILAEGHHTLHITIHSSDGNTATHQRQIMVVKPGGFSFLSRLDLIQATVSIEGNKVILRQVRVTDKLTQQSRRINLKLHWLTGLQSLTVLASEML